MIGRYIRWPTGWLMVMVSICGAGFRIVGILYTWPPWPGPRLIVGVIGISIAVISILIGQFGVRTLKGGWFSERSITGPGTLWRLLVIVAWCGVLSLFCGTMKTGAGYERLTGHPQGQTKLRHLQGWHQDPKTSVLFCKKLYDLRHHDLSTSLTLIANDETG